MNGSPRNPPNRRRDQGQRISMWLKSKDFRQEVRVHHAAEHLSTKAVLDGMTLEQRHREASQPTEIVAECSLSRPALILAKGYVQHPVHRLDAPMAPDRFAESLATEVTAKDVVSRLVGL